MLFAYGSDLYDFHSSTSVIDTVEYTPSQGPAITFSHCATDQLKSITECSGNGSNYRCDVETSRHGSAKTLKDASGVYMGDVVLVCQTKRASYALSTSSGLELHWAAAHWWDRAIPKWDPERYQDEQALEKGIVIVRHRPMTPEAADLSLDDGK